MKFFQLGAFLLLWAAFSSAQLDPAPISQNGAAIVVNDCNFTVFLKSVGNNSAPLSKIPPKGIYKETYRLNILNGSLNANGTVNGLLGGVSIKLSSNQSISGELNESEAFDNSTITQFEYTYNPNSAPGLWYDISNVNGYLDDGSCGTWPFDLWGGLILEGTSNQCPSVTCPPNNCTCSAAYTNWYDSWANHGCRNNNSLVLTLCSTVADQKGFEDSLAGGESQPVTNATSCSSR